MTASERFARLPTAAKLLLILTAVLLPIGIALAIIGEAGMRSANRAIAGQADDRARITARSIESLIARNALALRVSANAALASRGGDACQRMRNALAISPGVVHQFELESPDGTPLCKAGDIGQLGQLEVVAPGAITVRISPRSDAIAVRTGVIGGMATAVIPLEQVRDAAVHSQAAPSLLRLQDGARQLNVLDPGPRSPRLAVTEWPIAGDNLNARIGISEQPIAPIDRLILALPLLMWFAAVLIAWLVVNRLLIRPLRKLEGAIIEYQPGETSTELPRNLGPALEIEALRDAFVRAIDRVEFSEQESSDALEGQRRLVREVHHRVKNNLQVVASLLNIHSRSAEAPDVRAAYAAISRRVGALSVVHRNHFADVEESRGIALRPLLTELAAELRVSAPDNARSLYLDLDLDMVNTTQDVAVAVAFLVTEIVEFAMLRAPEDPVEIALRRTSELTARLILTSKVLTGDDGKDSGHQQFERIVSGLAKQLRSALERKLGRYSVELPVFPPN
jgi:two-component system, sensor histidine kinase PdtaS